MQVFLQTGDQKVPSLRRSRSFVALACVCLRLRSGSRGRLRLTSVRAHCKARGLYDKAAPAAIKHLVRTASKTGLLYMSDMESVSLLSRAAQKGPRTSALNRVSPERSTDICRRL